MINAQELRIGNVVIYRGEVNNIYALSLNGKINLRKPELFSPVELIPEILEACGFVDYSEETSPMLPFVFADKHHVINPIEDGFIFHPFCTNDKDCHVVIKYLHQLQNLYFALTGTELKISLPIDNNKK